MSKRIFYASSLLNLLIILSLFLLLPKDIVIDRSDGEPSGDKTMMLVAFSVVQAVIFAFFFTMAFFVKYPFSENRMDDVSKSLPFSMMGITAQKQSPEYWECMKTLMIESIGIMGTYANAICFLLIFDLALKNGVPPLGLSDETMDFVFVALMFFAFIAMLLSILYRVVKMFRNLKSQPPEQNPVS